MKAIRQILSRKIAALLAAALLFPLAACRSKTDPTPANFLAGLNAYFAEHPDCLFTDPPGFPYETTDPVKIKQMDALTGVKLLTVRRAPEIRESRYTLTDAGARAAPRFCFGHRIATGIDNFSPPTRGSGPSQTTVAYHYTLQDVPVWARTDEMRAAFPAMATEIAGASAATANMRVTIGGWEVWQ